MKLKTKMLVDRFLETISAWPGIECISLNEAALSDTLDPYFTFILDIYYDGSIPDSKERSRLYGDDVAAFESAERGICGKSGASKDRFLLKNTPIHLEYKPIKLVEERVAIADKNLDSFEFIKDSGTYSFYRLSNGEIVYSKSDWIYRIRERIKNLSDEFWQLMRIACESKMEHFLSDLGAAAIQGDDFNCLISAAGFIKSACLTLFCINHCFEPSHKAYSKQVLELPVLPESFISTFETFLTQDHSSVKNRSYELAKLMAKGIVVL